MYSMSDITLALAKMGVDPAGTLLVHSSMRSLGEVGGGADTVLDALSSYMSQGLLILPTHSWATINFGDTFDYRREPACTGILPNLFMKRPGVIRSLHPTHSVGALGADAASYVEGEENVGTPCARGGCWGKMLDRGAKVLFLGCGVACNTFLHGVEEWNDVPDRLTSYEKAYYVVLRDGTTVERLHRHHHSDHASDGDVSIHYSKIMPYFIERGAAHWGRICDANCCLADCRMMYELTSPLLKRDPVLFNDFKPILV